MDINCLEVKKKKKKAQQHNVRPWTIVVWPNVLCNTSHWHRQISHTNT